MKALSISEYGSPEKMELRDLNVPAPAADDVLIEVKMASINPIDWKIRRGDVSLILPRKFPRVLGIDVAGVVSKVGSSVKKFKVGENVFGMADPFRNQHGSYAQFCLVQDTKLAPMPEHFSFEDAASVPVAGLTAYKALFEHGAMRPGHHILVNGASGGVGSFAVQLAKIAGAKVTAVCGPDNIEFVRSLGADEVLNYKETDVKKLQVKEKFAIIFDVSAKLDYFAAKDLLMENGVFVGTNPKADLVMASAMTAPFGGKKAVLVLASTGNKISQELAEIANLIVSKKLQPVISKTVTLGHVPEAHKEAEKEHTRGKVLVRV